MSVVKQYSFEVGTPLGRVLVNGRLNITDELAGSYCEGAISGVVNQSFRFDIPVLGEVCSPELGFSPLVGKVCFRLNLTAKSLQGAVRTKNFPSGDWSDPTWVDLGSW